MENNSRRAALFRAFDGQLHLLLASLSAAGAAWLIFSATANYPSFEEFDHLLQIRGNAQDFQILPASGRGNSVVSFKVEGYRKRFWTNALTSVPVEWRSNPPLIEVWALAEHKLIHRDGSEKTYGLRVNDQEWVTVFAAIEYERQVLLWFRILATALGLASPFLMLLFWKRVRRNGA